MDGLEAAWDKLHAALSPGWVTGRPIVRDDTHVWEQYAVPAKERHDAGKRKDEWLATHSVGKRLRRRGFSRFAVVDKIGGPSSLSGTGDPVNVPDTRLTTFPADDHVFAAFVRQAYLGLDDHGRDPSKLEASLRRWHTHAVVREQHGLASFGEPRWYVYRDGHPGVKVDDAWWEAEGAATIEFGADGVFTFADDAACELVDLAPGALPGRHWSDLVPPSARDDDGAWIWEQLDRTGCVQSVFDLPVATGVRVIEYRTERVADDHFRSHWRQLATVDANPSREEIRA